MTARYFEDLREGQVALSRPLLIDKDELLQWARRYDPQYFHANEQAATHSVFGGLVAPGIFTAAIWRQLDHSVNGDVRYVCGTGWDRVRWPHPVRPGDQLRARSTVLKKTNHWRNPRWGKALYGYELLNQHDKVVMSFRSHNLVERQPPGRDTRKRLTDE